ncbi:MAG: TonB-dependent receptor [Thermoflavifilum aggregans]|nr:TonB-dependent receptor [Thermoflavifilum aggregans]
MKHIFLSFILNLLLLYALAQSSSAIHGIVINASTLEPVAGAVIRDLHNKVIALTDAQGRFSFSSSDADSLVISCLGYETLKIPAIAAFGKLYLKPAATALQEMVVTASREGEQRSTVPVALSVISSRMMQQTHAITLDQLLNQVTGVYMVDLGNEQHTMAIRQPIGYRSVYLYLEDGIPIRTVGNFNHNALIEINSAAVKNIEIIRGPSSSLYGSDAIGGAVNFITYDPSAIPAAKLSVDGSSIGYHRAQFQVSGTKNKMGIGLYGYYANQHDTYHQHNDFHKLALTLKGDAYINDHLKWENELSIIDYRSDMNGGLDSLDFYKKNYASYYTFNYRSVKAIRFASSLHYEKGKLGEGFATAYFRYNDIGQNPTYRIKRTANPLKATGEINDNRFTSYGLLMQHTLKNASSHLQAIFGINAEYSPLNYHAQFIQIQKDTAGYYISYTPTDSVLTDYHAGIDNEAAYMQLKWEPVQALYVVGGIRYDRLAYHFVNHLPPSAYTGAPSSTNVFSHVTPKIGLTYHLSLHSGFYANISQGFAPPDITDLYNGVKVPYLKPAVYMNYEAGGWFMWQQGKGSIQADVYRMIGTNEIISVRQDDGSYQNENAGKTLHEGLEYTIAYSPLAGVQFKWNGTWAYHEFLEYQINGKDYSHTQMNAAPKILYFAEITYHPGFLKNAYIAFDWQHVGKYYIDPANTQTYKGYDLFHIRSGYQWNRLGVWVNVLNVMNTIYATTVDYASYGNTYRAGIPRTWQIGVSYDFTGNPKS